jgi:hypothetical protein
MLPSNESECGSRRNKHCSDNDNMRRGCAGRYNVRIPMYDRQPTIETDRGRDITQAHVRTRAGTHPCYAKTSAAAATASMRRACMRAAAQPVFRRQMSHSCGSKRRSTVDNANVSSARCSVASTHCDRSWRGDDSLTVESGAGRRYVPDGDGRTSGRRVRAI